MAKSKAGSSGGNNKNLTLYVAALGALLMILVYVLVYRRLMEETEALEASNRALSTRVAELKVYYDARETYIQDTQLIEQLIDELLTVYPADAREEDAIILAVQMQRESGATFQSINMDRGDTIHTVSAETVAAAASEKYIQELQFNNMNTTYTNEVTYEGLKRLVQTIYDSSNRIGIQNIAYSKGDSEDPNLSGYMDLVFYSVSGTGKEYIAPDIVPYLAGTDNIFGEVVASTTNINNLGTVAGGSGNAPAEGTGDGEGASTEGTGDGEGALAEGAGEGENTPAE